jgi:Zn-dependent protease with chaperone function
MTPDFEPEQLLKVGLTALRQRAYDRAISTFEQLQQASVPKSVQIKAQMGLVRTYEEQGQWTQAIDLCKPLGQSNSRHVQAWAQTRLSTLTQKQAASVAQPTDDLSGFQPLNPEQPTLAPSDAGQPPLPITNSDSDQAVTSSDQAVTSSPATSGFQPLVPEVRSSEDFGKSQPLPPKTPNPDPMPESSPVSPTARHATGQSPPVSTPPNPLPISEVSLFHYQTLNQAERPQAEPTNVPPVEPTPPLPHSPTWPNAGRLKSGRSLGQVKTFKLWVTQGLTSLLLFGMLRFLLHSTLRGINGYVSMLDSMVPVGIRTIPAFYRDYTWILLGSLLLLGMASPWLWDLLLAYRDRMQPFSTRLLNAHSPEAVQTLRRICRRYDWPFPTLKRLPTDIPLIFSYGCLPRFARLVVSQGLLDQLQDDEIAALYAYEMSHWQHWDWPLLSLQGLLMQIFHQLYWQLSRWGNRQVRLVYVTAGVLATTCYGLFWLIQKTGTGVSRLRTYYCDRNAAEITGNPNGLIRALGKLSFGLTNALHKQGYTPPLIESLDLLLPLRSAGPQASLVSGDKTPLTTPWTWDVINPWRGWLSTNQSHPPLGDRFSLLTAYAQHWQLDLELDFQPLFSHYGLTHPRQKSVWHQQDWRIALLQASPWVGLSLGLVIGLLLWGLGGLARLVNWPLLAWLYGDASILKSSILLGGGIGILVRINRFFPDLDPGMKPTAQELSTWLVAPDLLPVDSLPICLRGTLRGRPGIANWLGQDLFLQLDRGWIKLHFFSSLGPLGNALKPGPRPLQYLNQPIQIWGWFRRGAQVWIDIDRLTTPAQTTLRANHPIWSVGLFFGLLSSGLWILIRGGT